jgi:hypothetical protein
MWSRPMPCDLIAAKIDEIEAEMRRIGYWFDNPPTPIPEIFGENAAGMPKVEGWSHSVADYNGDVRIDSPLFVLYLQRVFLPWARQRARDNNLPPKTVVGTVAVREYESHSINGVAQPLVLLLCHFDALVRDLHGRVGRGIDL